MEIEFYELGKFDEENLKFAVISAVYQGKWIYVRENQRNSWEIPGGHREIGESIEETARRELFEETGAKKFNLKPVCEYSIYNFSMNNSNEKSYGRLFFSEVEEIGDLPISEISEIKLFDGLPENLTYPELNSLMYKKTLHLK
ncbi:NUDIX domain-containing protein [Clostridium estertheticum]|uniref:NUDIX hydrolase n=1 Tax=Clostridium estertheticum TaxID=238834 RepID=UPI0013E952A4|nr:NUDIX domain-containing protein [Clostridium estertheticum]MBZ9687399.1 NUDIX domain-containing protein [Clostridium estertheticum]